MKPLLVLCLLLFAGIARADSSGTYDLTASAGFDVNGEMIQVDYSYQLTIVNGYEDSADPQWSVTDSAGNPWVLDYSFGGEFAVSDGPLQFAASLESCCDGIYIDQELYGPMGPTGDMLPQSWSATPVATPEPSETLLLLVTLAAMLIGVEWGLRKP